MRLLEHPPNIAEYSMDASGDVAFNYDPNYSYENGEGGYGNGEYAEGEGEDDADERLREEDYWTVITSFFEGKGLVRQQLESYNEFVENTMQSIISDNATLTLDQYSQHTGMRWDETVRPGPAKSGGMIGVGAAADVGRDGTRSRLDNFG